MAKQTINIGTDELSGDGETIRNAFIKVNSNFDELYSSSSSGSNDLTAIDGGSASTTYLAGDLTIDGGGA